MSDDELVINVDGDGALLFIDDGQWRGIYNLGTRTRRRASHVEPENVALRTAFHALRRLFGDRGRAAAFTRAWQCVWRVNMRPVGGPVLPRYYLDRTHALMAERRWLEENL